VSNGAATAWNPDANSSVEAIEVSGNIVYVGGTFTPTLVVPNSIGGAPRNNIAALDASTGLATSWDPNVNAAVHDLALAGSMVYAGGEFDSAGGETPRNNIAAFDATTGAVTAADPNANGAVQSLAVFGNTVYMGGAFTTLTPPNGDPPSLRSGIAALNATTGAPTSWNPGADLPVQALAVSPDGNTVYAGGDFTHIGLGASRNHLAALDAATGSATSWDPGADGTVSALATTSNKVYVGGSFTTIGGAPRSNLAFLKGTGTTGLLQPWDPSPDGPVYAILVGGTTPCTGTDATLTVYIGGNFTSLKGAQRFRIAAVKSSGSGTVCTNWNPNPTDNGGAVRALARSGDTLFMGGDFTSAGGFPLNRLAAVDVVSGSASSSWNPSADKSVRALAVSDAVGTPGRLYVGGGFSTIAGSTDPSVGLPRNNFAAFEFVSLGALVSPSSRSVLVGDQAAAWMIVFNNSTTSATDVSIAPKSNIVATQPFHFWTFDPAGFGEQDKPFTILPLGSQILITSFQPNGVIAPPTEVRYAIEGTNTTRAGSISGWDTMYLAASNPPQTSDILTSVSSVVVSSPETTSNCTPPSSIFGIAALNVGAGEDITVVSRGQGQVSGNVTVDICRVDFSKNPPGCVASPSPNLTFAGNSGETFAVFVRGNQGQSIACDFDNNRLFIEFRQKGPNGPGPLRGLASIAACTIGVCGQ
jgi:hypothetical protein